MTNIFRTTLYVALLSIATSCESNPDPYSQFEGKLSKRSTMWIKGFEDVKNDLLKSEKISARDFLVWSTDSAWSLPADAQLSLRSLRKAIETPTSNTLLQKVISLDDMPTYINNTYGGTIGGFVSVAGDMKKIANMFDTYWGLRLDYSGTKFKPDGPGYGIIRFFSPAAKVLTIPFCKELGGDQPHAWPNTGGGFTSSKLEQGGLPEYSFVGYSVPSDGAEIYEVSPEGREILRSVYTQAAGWKSAEIGSPAPDTKGQVNVVRNGVYQSETKSNEKVFVTTYARYNGNAYIARNTKDNQYRLTTQTMYDNVNLEVEEKGIWGITVAGDAVEDVWEEVMPLN